MSMLVIGKRRTRMMVMRRGAQGVPGTGGPGGGAVASVNGRTGAVVLAKADVGLAAVDNTSDANKPVSTATATALGGKAAVSHTHAQSEVTGLVTDLAGKAAASHTHAQSEVTGLVTDLAGKAATTHTHAQADVTGLVASLAGKAAASHTHAQSEVTGLVTDLAGKAAASHTHAQSEVTGLVTDLAGKAAASHTHAQSEVTGLVAALGGKEATGVAAGLVSAHELAADPHPQYTTAAELAAGNAGTATALQTARNINGVAFDGTADVTIPGAAIAGTGAVTATGGAQDAAATPFPDLGALIMGNATWGYLGCASIDTTSFAPAGCQAVLISGGTLSSLLVAGRQNGLGLNLTTTVNSQVAIVSARSSATAVLATLILGSGRAVFRCILRTPAALSDATNPYTIRMGFSASITSGANSCYLTYSHSQSANFVFTTGNAGAFTNNTTSVVVAAATDYDVVIIVNAAGTSAECFINGVSVGVITTNLPTARVAAIATFQRHLASAAVSQMGLFRWLYVIG
jgi:hypothetical protein